MGVYFTDRDVELRLGDAAAELALMPAESVNCVLTSPPYYGLRDYGYPGQVGLEATPAEYVEALRVVFDEARRVLRPDGVLWLNLGDSYSGKANGGATFDRHPGRGHRAGIVAPRVNTTGTAPRKSLLGIPWRVAFALIDDGWVLRNDVIWDKPNPMPESVTDRLSRCHEHVFLLTKSESYAFDLDAIRRPATDYAGRTWDQRRAAGEPNRQGLAGAKSTGAGYLAANPNGSNPGDVWSLSTSRFPGSHFATMPPALARRCVLSGCPEGGTVLDPFVGSGTSILAARQAGRRGVGIDLSAEYLDIAIGRIGQPTLDFSEAQA